MPDRLFRHNRREGLVEYAERAAFDRYLQARGPGLVEYALIIALVAIVVIVILILLGPGSGSIFSNVKPNL